jgi:hypothetical protein
MVTFNTSDEAFQEDPVVCFAQGGSNERGNTSKIYRDNGKMSVRQFVPDPFHEVRDYDGNLLGLSPVLYGQAEAY